MSDIKTVLIPTDFSDAAAEGVRTAVRLAQQLGAKLQVLYVVESRLPPLIYSTEAQRAELQRKHLENAEIELRRYVSEHLGGLDVEQKVRTGVPYDEIVACAADSGADLVVIATHGYGTLGQAFFGSTAQRVIQQAPCPVVTVRRQD